MAQAHTALVLLAPGTEEIEATVVVDVLRRAGITVTVAGLESEHPVTCSRGMRIVPDVALQSTVGNFDLIVLPGGGPGAERLAESRVVGKWLATQWKRGGLIGAICAAPLALMVHGIGLGLALTCHPSVAHRLATSYALRPDRVVETEQLITSQGPGTSFEFALALVARLRGSEVAKEVASPMLLPSVGDPR